MYYYPDEMKEHDEYICARCARNCETCCSLGAGGGYSGQECFPVSAPEAARIRRVMESGPALPERLAALHGPRMPGDVLVEEVNGPVFIKAMQAMFPGGAGSPGGLGAVERAFRPGGAHLRVALPDGRRCVFLAAEGCLLEPEHRPHFCRIYPFWLGRGGLWCFSDPNCLAVSSAKSMEALLELFGLTEKDVASRYATLKKEWNIDAFGLPGA